MGKIYENSRTHRITERLLANIKVYFRHSFLGVVTEINEDNDFQILYESKFIHWLLGLYNKWKKNFVYYLTNSETANLIEKSKSEFRNAPLKTASVIAIVAIVTNIVLSISLNKDVGLLGWLVRLALLFVGLGGIFCDAKLDEVEKTSFILKKLNVKGKNSTYNSAA